MQAHIPSAATVGDVTSNARGSGARYNANKAPMDLIPLWVVANSFADKATHDDNLEPVQKALYHLGRFQTTHDVAELDKAIDWLSHRWFSCARVFDYGRRKYAEWNWAKGMAWSVPLACAARHALAILDLDETLDSESNEAHEGHFMCNLVMLRTFYDSFKSGNDLPPPEMFAPL
ncbi:dATP/dGTP diphosphohydrolase domain-containing protein [Stenotrophomonas sp. SAU14A_NAIMI4_8]|uniref:dATP/dGTP diphosphohydrolase domain-containing protein n=1 Tax=Stenotrophomonas sp. SAU14A_NAIMI4_8 TaxID=2072409 RepID=UPI000D53CCF4|nr:dATP/dGTP diphosphohydrolase domain-containing protein [Stenotrophomonas sp. SAU14A_NAIMI4_8]AWH32207.1 hypothetical protein C1930_04635 [Stenotrophomonas sp. SAU14A_NAIMI4_8]